MTQPYWEFLAAKAQLADAGGFEPSGMPGHLFDYQAMLVAPIHESEEGQ